MNTETHGYWGVLCVLSSVTMTELRSLDVALNSYVMQTLLFGITVRS